MKILYSGVIHLVLVLPYNVILKNTIYNKYIWARNGFDGIESKGERKQVRHDLNSSNNLVANNNAHFNSVAVAA